MNKNLTEALLAIIFLGSSHQILKAQSDTLKLTDWNPKSQLLTKETYIEKPKFPVIDFHNHLRHLENMKTYMEEMDKAGVVKCVSLDGYSKDDFYKKHLKACSDVSKDRLLVFFLPDFSKIDEPDFGIKEAKKLEEAVRMGCRGMKIAKELGLEWRDKTGRIVPVDDPRIDPLWDKCAELGIPVMIHVTDPKAFFTPTDKYNERYDELQAHPDWSFYGKDYPSKQEILNQRNRVFAKHPNTIFVGAHVATLPEDLEQVSMWLDIYPNLYIDFCARISELGRQPYSARKFMIKYQDRILFGTDTPCNAESYRVYYRFLETDDEYFDPTPAHHQQGRWMIYGIYLPDEVLEKIYNKNAAKLLNMYKGS
jgi:uncharacterized protein